MHADVSNVRRFLATAVFRVRMAAMRCNARQKQLLLDRVVLFTPVQPEIDKGQATRVRRKTTAFLFKRCEKWCEKRSFCRDRLGTDAQGTMEKVTVFSFAGTSGRQLIYKNRTSAAAEAAAVDGVKSGCNGGGGGEGGRRKRMLRKR